MTNDSANLITLFRMALLILTALACGSDGYGRPLSDSGDQTPGSLIRLAVLPINGEAELLTFFMDGRELDGDPDTEPIPLFSVLRDTLGSADPLVHRLRYVWLHSSTDPSLRQRLASGVPFLYDRVGNAPVITDRTPRHLMDLSEEDSALWNRIRDVALQALPFYPTPTLLVSSLRTYGRNQTLYRQAQFARVSTILDLYVTKDAAPPAISPLEIRQLQSRTAQSQKLLGTLLSEASLERMYHDTLNAMRQASARNWELLRQQAETDHLYFDPLLLPDGTATHALLWVAREDLTKNRGREFDGRFLSISNPWTDRKLLNWDGVTATHYFDAYNRRVPAAGPGIRAVEVIPLAVYGLDYPKIPALLVDFRKPGNAQRRELSGRLRDAIVDNLFDFTALETLGRIALHVPRRTGADVFQPSRSRSYSQLKMLLAMDSALAPEVRREVARLVESVGINPLDNDLKTEVLLARNEYESLIRYAQRPDGLTAQIEKDRRSELTARAHGGSAKVLFKVARVLSLGLYKHREDNDPNIKLQLEEHRRSEYHERFLRDVIQSGPDLEIQWDLDKVRTSLNYVAASGVTSRADVIRIARRIALQTRDENIRRLCFETVYRLESDLRDGVELAAGSSD